MHVTCDGVCGCFISVLSTPVAGPAERVYRLGRASDNAGEAAASEGRQPAQPGGHAARDESAPGQAPTKTHCHQSGPGLQRDDT